MSGARSRGDRGGRMKSRSGRRDADIVLRPGTDGVQLVPDRAYPRAYTLRVGRTDQSYVDLDDPLRLEFDYLQRMADVVDCAAEPGRPVRVVHVGGAAMTLARYIAATRPHSVQLVLEPDAELTAFVRAHLPLPKRSGITVRSVDGCTGVAALPNGHAQLLILDAFVGARVPAEVTTVEFFRDVRRVLAGVASSFPQRLLCAEPSTLKGRRFGNVIMVGSAGALPVAEIAERAGNGPYPYRVLHGTRITQLLTGVAPLAQADGQLSPEPPRGRTHFE